MPRPCALVVLLVLLSSAFIGVTTAQEATPPASPTAPDGSGMAIDPFYEPPSPLPPGRPGALLRAAPVPVPPGVRALRILYRSTAPETAPAAPSPARSSPPIARRLRTASRW